MSMIVAALIFVPLLAVALAHFVWALGGTWPIRNETLLAQTVVGRPGITKMPPRSVSLAVAVLVLTAGIVGLALADASAGGLGLTLLGLATGAVFIGRGIAGYTAGWRARFPEEPFASLDRKQYSPLCLLIGAGFLLLVIMRLI